MTGSFGYGQMTPWDTASDFNVTAFIIRQMMAKMVTTKLVRVQAVNSNGEVAAAPTVDVLPLVNQVDGNNNATPHGTVHGLPVFRLQGGPCAFILDPQVGDVGYVVAADRDISNAKANPGKQVTPGSFRKFDLADGIYVGGVLNAAPTCYVLFKADGHFKIVDVSGNVLETSASGFAITGNLAVTGNITATGEVVRNQGAPSQVSLGTHLHTSGGAGSPTSAPTPGT